MEFRITCCTCILSCQNLFLTILIATISLHLLLSYLRSSLCIVHVLVERALLAAVVTSLLWFIQQELLLSQHLKSWSSIVLNRSLSLWLLNRALLRHELLTAKHNVWSAKFSTRFLVTSDWLCVVTMSIQRTYWRADIASCCFVQANKLQTRNLRTRKDWCSNK